jgi:hypothetical protein
MKINDYESPYCKILFLQKQDIIAGSPNESADDLGGWNNAWFSQSKE